MSMLEELLHGPAPTTEEPTVAEAPDLVCAELQRLGIHATLQRIVEAPYYARLTEARKIQRLRQVFKAAPLKKPAPEKPQP